MAFAAVIMIRAFSSTRSRHLGTILLPELGANVEFGDADRKTLYIAARTSIYRIRVNVEGIP